MAQQQTSERCECGRRAKVLMRCGSSPDDWLVATCDLCLEPLCDKCYEEPREGEPVICQTCYQQIALDRVLEK